MDEHVRTDVMANAGWFDSPEQETPVFDPGLSVGCPCCGRPLHEQPRKTISLMPVGGHRSYFFRAHKTCWDAADEATQIRIESEIIDADVLGAQ